MVLLPYQRRSFTPVPMQFSSVIQIRNAFISIGRAIACEDLEPTLTYIAAAA